LKTIKKRLNSVPPDLEKVSEHIVKTLIIREDKPRSLLLNEWILFTLTPLSLRELHWATACDGDIPSSHPKFEKETYNDDIIDNVDLINTLSGGLVKSIPASA
jgi:hypothetical protein